jgi:S-adenosylmethionine synthetase
MSLEAAAGKNPVSHIGKIYNVVAHKIAASLVERVPEIASAHCFLLGRIGEPVERPAIVDIRVRPRDHVPVGACNEPVRAIVASALGSLGAVAEEMLRGGVKVF